MNVVRRQLFAASLSVAACVMAVAGVARSATEWNPKLAADYLDTRQKEWFAWKPAQSSDGPCVSCHTGARSWPVS